ncbi:conserved hypothetical protein [Trichinella spiralis]|uniref:hypothetical protein n=1 Tax=Trichinella spiralis TaxID=6334 RepID=UPI0001EFCAB3|nr:conserved hypothetical protein [Trichinella spiralis]
MTKVWAGAKARSKKHAATNDQLNFWRHRRKENGRWVPTAAATAESPGNGKLPELRLPQFTWSVLKFPTFWAQYASRVHERSDLDIATKFAYLVPTTEGKMRSTIERILITAANYPLAAEILKSRLSQPEIVACERNMTL